MGLSYLVQSRDCVEPVAIAEVALVLSQEYAGLQVVRDLFLGVP